MTFIVEIQFILGEKNCLHKKCVKRMSNVLKFETTIHCIIKLKRSQLSTVFLICKIVLHFACKS